MRLRYKPYARPELAAWPHCVNSPAVWRGRWRNAFFDPQKPLRLEVGCGKGGFLARLALREGEANYLGLDIKSEMLVVAKRNIERLYAEKEQPLGNILLAAQEVERLGEIFALPDQFSRIYINFCNPWAKTGYAKHRLTHPRQLAQYRDVMPVGGEIWFKTDDETLFRDSLRYFAYTGFAVVWQTENLHKEEPGWNIRTEHEQMFAAAGVPIRACVARMRPAQLDREAIRRLKNV